MRDLEPRTRAIRCKGPLCASAILLLLGVGAFAGVWDGIEPVTRIGNEPRHKFAADNWFLGEDGKHGGGVVPWGFASFVEGDSKKEVACGSISIRVADKDKLLNRRQDYDTFELIRQGNAYNLDTDDEVFERLIRFIDRGGRILYTIPPVVNEEYFTKAGLVQWRSPRGDYIAKEFNSPVYFDLLLRVDLLRGLVDLPTDLERSLVNSVNRDLPQGLNRIKSYVNADFNVTYLVHLASVDGNRIVNIGGVPLRYYWNLRDDQTLEINHIKMFKLPRNSDRKHVQYQAVALFQAAAILRQFKRDNSEAFSDVLQQIDAIRQEAGMKFIP